MTEPGVNLKLTESPMMNGTALCPSDSKLERWLCLSTSQPFREHLIKLNVTHDRSNDRKTYEANITGRFAVPPTLPISNPGSLAPTSVQGAKELPGLVSAVDYFMTFKIEVMAIPSCNTSSGPNRSTLMIDGDREPRNGTVGLEHADNRLLVITTEVLDVDALPLDEKSAVDLEVRLTDPSGTIGRTILSNQRNGSKLIFSLVRDWLRSPGIYIAEAILQRGWGANSSFGCLNASCVAEEQPTESNVNNPCPLHRFVLNVTCSANYVVNNGACVPSKCRGNEITSEKGECICKANEIRSTDTTCAPPQMSLSYVSSKVVLSELQKPNAGKPSLVLEPATENNVTFTINRASGKFNDGWHWALRVSGSAAAATPKAT